MIYILHMIFLNWMIMFLMMTYSVFSMMISRLCLIMNYTKLQNSMITIIIFHDHSLILKYFLRNRDRQNSDHSTKFLINLIFATLTLFTTLLPRLLTNQIPVHFNQSQTFNRNTPTKNGLQPLPRKNYCLFTPSPSSSDK